MARKKKPKKTGEACFKGGLETAAPGKGHSRIAAGKLVGCFALQEHALVGPGVAARRDGGEYILNGGNSWVMAAWIADLAILWGQVTSFPLPNALAHAQCGPSDF